MCGGNLVDACEHMRVLGHEQGRKHAALCCEPLAEHLSFGDRLRLGYGADTVVERGT